MKRLITLILAFSMLLSLCGCGYIRQIKVEAIKRQIISSFSANETVAISEENGSFNALFDPFLQDYLISDIRAENELKSIWRKGYLLGLNYVATRGNVFMFYSPTQEKAYQYYEFNNNVSARGSAETEEDPTTLFQAFGIDISMLYHTDDDTDSSEKPTLRDMTEDDLTVSDDLLSCTISTDYIKELAKTSFITTDSYSEKELEAYFAEFYGEGKIDLEKQTFTIRFGSNTTSAPKMNMNIEATVNGEDSFQSTLTMEGEQNVDGERVPFNGSIRLSNFQYVDGKPVKGDIEINLSVSMDMYKSTGVDMKVESTQSYVCNIDLSDTGAPTLMLKIQQSSKMTQGTTVSESSTEQYLQIDPKKDKQQLVYREKQDGRLETEITADSVIIGQHDKVAPEAVIQYHAKNSK